MIQSILKIFSLEVTLTLNVFFFILAFYDDQNLT